MIRFTKYVRIISGVGGSAIVRERDLIARFISQSELVSPDSVLEFADAAAVGDFFGTTSPEYKRAAFYFGYVSPSISAPRRISFSRFVASGTYPKLFGGRVTASLATLKTIVAGVLTLKIAGTDETISAIDLSTAATFNDIATLLQTALRTSPNPYLDGATVQFDAPSNSFKVIATGSGPLADVSFDIVQAGAGLTDAASYLAFYPELDAILTAGAAPQTVSDAFTKSVALSNNFGSFNVMPHPISGDVLTIEQHAELAALNAGYNVAFMYSIPVTEANAETWSAALIGFASCCLTLAPIATEYPEVVPMAQLAATDYGRRNATVNYMFKQFPLTPSVTDDATSDAMDALRVNYYGRTQTAGQTLDFYQRGLMMGPVSAPVDMNVHGNEQWLKDAAAAAIMNLLVSTGRVPANESGRATILATVQDVIDRALLNGVISVGKALTALQKNFVTQQTGDPLAWHQIEAVGYVVDATIVAYVGAGGSQEYKCVYSLLYSKDDAIRFVEGSHSLI